MSNVVVPLLMISAGGALVWSGITDPEGGTFAGLSALMNGQTPAKRAADPTAGQSIYGTLASVAANGGGGGGNATPAAVTSTPSTPSTPTPSTPSVYNLGPVKPHVARAANIIGPMFAITSIGGYRASAIDPQGHPAGLALDFMVSDSRGTALSAFALANKARFAVRYVIWRQRINDGSGWRAMEDRGSATQNHMDHVHISFSPSSGSATT